MMKNELKSVLRNKSNLIYIIIFSILFVVLNIFLNVGRIIDDFFDMKINEYIKTASQEDSEMNSEKIDLKKIIRTIQTTDGKELDEEQKQKLKKMKHVQMIESEDTEVGDVSITINNIVIDDWKNCADIQKYLDNQGIDNYVDTIGMDEKIFENYKILKNFSKIMKYTIIILSIAILSVCCKNILKNEEENLKLLNILGYKRNKIKGMIISQLFILIFIGLICGYIIYSLLFLRVFNHYGGISLNLKIIANVIVMWIPIFINAKRLKLN